MIVFIDSRSTKVVYHQIVKTEKDMYYKKAINKLREKGCFPYKHSNVGSAIAGIQRYYEYLFTYEKYPELNIEKTTNRIERLFKEPKDK